MTLENERGIRTRGQRIKKSSLLCTSSHQYYPTSFECYLVVVAFSQLFGSVRGRSAVGAVTRNMAGLSGEEC